LIQTFVKLIFLLATLSAPILKPDLKTHTLLKESLANAMVSARQPWYIGLYVYKTTIL